MDRDEGNKTHKHDRCHFTFALSKPVLENGLEDLWRRENPDHPSSPATTDPLAQDPGLTGLTLM